MPTISAATGSYILNGSDVQFIRRLMVAREVCSPAPLYSVQVNFDCSLACTAIGWPMQMGVLMMSFYTDDPDCPSAGIHQSIYIPAQIALPLGCVPGDPSPEGVWQGQAAFSTVLIPGPPQLGMSFRFQAYMTVEDDASVTVSVIMQRIVPNSEYTPHPADGSNVYIECATFSQNLTRYLSPGTDPLARNINWIMTNSNLVSVIPSGSYCDTDIHSANLSVILMPYKLGCDGMADNLIRSDCSLDTGYRTYSCFGLLVEPITPNAWPAQWVQMGTNKSLDYRCYNGSNSVSSPPIAASLDPTPIYPTAAELLNCGCGGEDPVNGDIQQIQFGLAAGYDVVIKSVNKGLPCLAIRVSGTGNSWTVDTTGTVDEAILADTGHYIRTASFPDVDGAPKVVAYAMEFPSGILAECVPIPPEGISPRARDMKTISPVARDIKPAKVKSLISRMAEVKKSPCVHLGMALETEASCGCSGGLLHSCSIHGKCRIVGNTIEMNCWRCDSYTPKPEALDGPSVDKLSGPPDSI